MKSLSEALQYIRPIFEASNALKAEWAVAEMWKYRDTVHSEWPAEGYYGELIKTTWPEVIQCHIGAIKQYLNKTADNYSVCSYGKTEVGQLYSSVVKKYAKLFRSFASLDKNKDQKDYEYWTDSNKHQFDPTDVIVYRNDIDITTKLNSLLEASKWENIQSGMRELFNSKVLFGVSLKKTTTGTINEFNTGKESPSIKVNSAKYEDGALIANGQFMFNGIGVVNEDASVEEPKDDEILIICRSFGGRVGVGIDVKFPNSPALGKVEKSKWLKWLGIKDRKPDLQTVREALKNMEADRNTITLMIKSAIKDGDYCLPFILIH